MHCDCEMENSKYKTFKLTSSQVQPTPDTTYASQRCQKGVNDTNNFSRFVPNGCRIYQDANDNVDVRDLILPMRKHILL
jgi:hypothetical protein